MWLKKLASIGSGNGQVIMGLENVDLRMYMCSRSSAASNHFQVAHLLSHFPYVGNSKSSTSKPSHPISGLTSKSSEFQFCWWPHQVCRNDSTRQIKIAPDLPPNGSPSPLNDVPKIQNELAASPLSLVDSPTVETVEISGSDEQTDDLDVIWWMK